MFIAYLVISYCANSIELPKTIYPDSLITRPWDIGPLLLYVIAGLLIFPAFFRRNPSLFSHSLMISAIPQIAVELHMAFGSTELFDAHFNIAHFLKIVAYIMPLIGLMLEYTRIYSDQNVLLNKLMESEEWAKTIYVDGPDAIMLRDAEGYIYSFNPAAERLLGYTSEEVVGKKIDIFLPTQDLENKLNGPDSDYVMDIDKTQSLEIKHKDGREFPVEISTGETSLNGKSVYVRFIRDISQRIEVENKLKTTNEELIKSQRLLQAVMDNSPATVFIKDLQGRYLFVNKLLSDEIGMPVEEIIDHTVYDLFPIESAENIGLEDRQVIETAMPLEIERISLDGNFIYAINKFPLIDDKGDIYAIGGIGKDITERKESEQKLAAVNFELAKSQALIQALMDNSPATVFIKDLEGRYLIASKLLSDEIGKPVEEIIGHTDYDLWPADFADNLRIKDRQVVETAMPLESEQKSLDGNTIYAINKFPLIDDKGDIYAVGGIGKDITERKESEQKLAAVNLDLTKSQDLLQAVMDNSPTLIYIKDLEGHFLLVNRSVSEAINKELEEIIGLTDYDIFPAEFAIRTTSIDREVLDTGEGIQLEQEYPFGKGQYQTYKFPLINENNEIYAICAISSDITERAHHEKQLEDMNRNLERSNKDLEQFAYVASHDLQEPLRMVASYTQLLENRYADKLDDTAREFMDYTIDGAKRMQSLIQDLLLFSRLDSHGKFFEDVNLNNIYDEIINDLAISIKESGTIISKDDLPIVSADETQLRQLLQNLIGNAIKYRDPKRENLIHIAVEKKNTHWEFSVKDNGIGIAKEFYERIFIIFQRLHAKSEYSGTGIGLAICKKIVERHNGEIRVNSIPEQGSEFIFTLPA